MSTLIVQNVNASGVITCTTPATGTVGAIDIMPNASNVGRIRFMQNAGTAFFSLINTNTSAVFSGNVTAFSDIKLKENIEVIDDALQKVLDLRGVTFTRNDQIDKERKHIGLIAQEVEKVLPEVVDTSVDCDDEGVSVETKSISYGVIVSVLIEAIKEQNKQIEDLKNRLEILENR